MLTPPLTPVLPAHTAVQHKSSLYEQDQIDFDDVFWALVAGWLEIGGNIAGNLREYTKLFVFFPWAVFSIRHDISECEAG